MAIPPDRNMHSDKPSTSTSEGRKSSKPIMEKRRRARINASLSELKNLLLEVIKTEGSRHSKMEKADILEMTVKHLRQLQRQQFTGSPKTDSNVLDNYRQGFNECAQEVTRYLTQMEITDVNLRSKILDHLAGCFSSGIFNPSPPSTPVSSAPQSVSPPSQTCGSSPQLQIPSLAQIAPSPSLVYNQISPDQTAQKQTIATVTSNQLVSSSNPVQMTNLVSAVQLIPTKLQTGEIAFVMPNSVFSSSAQAPSYIIPVYPSGSTAGTLQPTQTPPVATVAVNNMAFQTLPIVPTPQHLAPQIASTVSSEQMISVNPGLGLSTPSIAPYHPNVSFFSSLQTPPTHVMPSPLIPLQPRPLLSPEQLERHNEQPREDAQLHHDESMWRPW